MPDWLLYFIASLLHPRAHSSTEYAGLWDRNQHRALPVDRHVWQEHPLCRWGKKSLGLESTPRPASWLSFWFWGGGGLLDVLRYFKSCNFCYCFLFHSICCPESLIKVEGPYIYWINKIKKEYTQADWQNPELSRFILAKLGRNAEVLYPCVIRAMELSSDLKGWRKFRVP